MSRPKNPANKYVFHCPVMNIDVPTNPKQFNDVVSRYGVEPEVVEQSYVSREGRKVLAGQKLTAEQAVALYPNLDIRIARQLKAIVKEVPANNVETLSVEIPAMPETSVSTIVEESSETELVYQASEEEKEETLIAA